MRNRIRIPAALLLIAVASSCFKSSATSSGSTNVGSESTFSIESVSNGFGRLLPYVVHQVHPITKQVSSSQTVEIRSIQDLIDNPSSPQNPVLPVANWPTTATLPGLAKPGNHFVAVEFDEAIDIETVLDPTAAGLVNNGLTGAISIIAYFPDSGLSERVYGRGFINGRTYYPAPWLPGNPMVLEQWVTSDPMTNTTSVTAVDVDRNGVLFQPGTGYPGTDDPSAGIFNAGFDGAAAMVSPNVFVFIPDADQDLQTHETFPENAVIHIVIETGVRDVKGNPLADSGRATSQVGPDLLMPATMLDGIGGQPVVSPLDLATDVPCDSPIMWRMSEACQPHSFGNLPSDTGFPVPSTEFTVSFQPPVPPGFPPPNQSVQLSYTVLPASPFDFTEFELSPVHHFPGSDSFGAVSTVQIDYNPGAGEDFAGNGSVDAHTINFTVGECPGIVNAPVSPGVIYVGSSGTVGGLRVIDLDGFGQGTGDPTHDYTNPNFNLTYSDDGTEIVPRDSNGVVVSDVAKFPFNANVVQGLPVYPPLAIGQTTLDGGSAGVFTMARSSTLSDRLVDDTMIAQPIDIMIGHSLDKLYNQANCLAGGGNNPCVDASLQTNPLAGTAMAGNTISFVPHPNPPKLLLGPTCYAPYIDAEEPGRPTGGGVNLLGPGDAFGDPYPGPLSGSGRPPDGFLSLNPAYSQLNGPSLPLPPAGCPPFAIRQQVGHFLYILDGQRDEVVCLNSNRMTVIARIPVASPRDMALSSNLNLLGVSNGDQNEVTFIDTDPLSPSFHSVLKRVKLELGGRKGERPGEIVFQPDDEDVLVCCEKSNSIALISPATMVVRKFLVGVSQPRFICATERDPVGFNGNGFATGLWHAYIISETGQMSIYESGPDGNNGIGYDDVIGTPSLEGRSGFDLVTAVQPDPASYYHGIYIAHQEGGYGVVSHLEMTMAPFGPLQLGANPLFNLPTFRAKEWEVDRQYGINGELSSPRPLDIALDDLNNIGALGSDKSSFSDLPAAQHSGRDLQRLVQGARVLVSSPQYLFVAHGNGLVDVIDLVTGDPVMPRDTYLGFGVSPISAPAVNVLGSYWRQ